MTTVNPVTTNNGRNYSSLNLQTDVTQVDWGWVEERLGGWGGGWGQLTRAHISNHTLMGGFRCPPP